jgi:hypothetical protein
MSILTVEDVQTYVADGYTGDTPGESSFSRADIEYAMKLAAAEYNDIPPQHIHANPRHLPAETNIFRDFSAYFLFSMRQRRQANDLTDYDAGGQVVNLDKARLPFMKAFAEECLGRGRAAASSQKRTCNLKSFYGVISPLAGGRLV